MDASGYGPVFPYISLSPSQIPEAAPNATKQATPVPHYLTSDTKAQPSICKLETQIHDELSDRNLKLTADQH